MTTVNWSPAAGLSGGAALALSDGNLTARNQGSSNSTVHVRASAPVSGARVYFEARFVAVPNVRYGAIGVVDAALPLPTANSNLATGTWVLCDDGKISANGAGLVSALPAFVAGDVAMVLIDLDLGKMWVGRNGVWAGNPDAGTGWAMSGLPAQVYAKATAFTYLGMAGVLTANFGATPFAYDMPVGAVAYSSAITEAPGAYADPRPTSWPTLTNIRKDTYTVTPPSVNLPMVFSGPSGYSPPYSVVGESLPMVACLPGDIITARWSQEFTNDMATGPEKLCECAGMLMLERIADPSTPLTIYNAGPSVDFRCMSENRGANVSNNPQHHIEITWDGQSLVLAAGDYVVRARAYASPGDSITPAPGSAINVHDGDLIVYRERSITA